MVKNHGILVERFLFLLVCACAFCAVADVRQWSGAAPAITFTDDGGFVRLETEDDSYCPPVEKVGAPALPYRTILFAIPDYTDVADVSFEISWETLSEKVKVIPIAEPVRDGETLQPAVPDPVLYGGTAVYPTQPVVRESIGTMSGVRILSVCVTPFRWHPDTGLLERASALTVQVSLVESTDRSYVLSPLMLDSVRAAVVNAADVTLAPAAKTAPVRKALKLKAAPTLMTASTASSEHVDYLLLSPPDFVSDWEWYVGERKKTHTNLVFKVKNTAEIYAEYPFPTDDVRNAAESIHAYLRANRKTMGFTYVVLGGAWLDVQNRLGYKTYFASGELMSLSNSVPGIYGYPRENWRNIPSDMFYACLDLVNGQKYPWDWDGNGYYINQNECSKNDLYPDVIVSRLTLNPFTGTANKFYNQHTLITNYVAKLKRGEAKDFAGHYRYGMSAASTGSSKLRKTGDRMYYRELEFYDGMRNMFDPYHHDTLEDDEWSTRVRYYEQYSNWRPIREVKGLMSLTWTGGLPNLSSAIDDYYAADRDFGFVQAHGWAQGAAHFSAGRFATAKGLTLFNGGSGPCETGYPDYYVLKNGLYVLEYNVGDAAVTNPNGGALASVNNSRWSWAGASAGYGAMSYYMLNQMLIGFNQERMDVGHAWLKGVIDYYPAGKGGGTAGWVLTEQFLYGDPLVQLPRVPNVWWRGGETGAWDGTTSNWTNDVDSAKTFDAAYNVYFNVGTNLTLDVTGEIAAMRLSLPVWEEDAILTFAGTGTLRVMQCVDVAGTNTTLRFNVKGGVGHNGIQFLTGAGDLVFEGTNKFYVGGIKNARQVKLLGGGVTLDVDEFPSGAFPLVFDGSDTATLPIPNELRSKNVGGLLRFGSLAMTNTYVKLSTVDAFGKGAPQMHTLVDSKLEIAANAYYQRSGYPEGLNATFLVDGNSAVTSSLGGLWTVKHTTTFALGSDTHLTLGAETVNAGGKIVITNVPSLTAQTNTVEILHANALAGDVTIGKGIRLVLHELPLASVTSLTLEDGASVELPEDASGYWQIVPVSSKFTCASSVTFASSADPTKQLEGSPSPTGAFFKKGALYSWAGTEGAWTDYFTYRHPKILFGDLAANDVTVRVASAVAPEFVFYSNVRTKYVFEAQNEGASILFPSVFLYGPTIFDVPVSATEYVTISAATSCFCSVTAPYVHVVQGAALALSGSHWTDFRLDAGAVLTAVPGTYLDVNRETTLTFPSTGLVTLDVDGLSLSSEPTVLIAGRGRTWTADDFGRFHLSRPDAELRIVDGKLCVVSGDEVDAPYALTFEGITNWNCAAWTATNGVAFPRAWGACALDWAADVDVTVTNAGDHILLADADVHADRLAIHTPTNADFVLRACDGYEIAARTIDLTDVQGDITIEVGTGAAEVLVPTNETSVCTLKRGGSGTLKLSGATLILETPGDFTLSSGSQGTLRFVATQGYERFRVVKVAAGFELGGLSLGVIDRDGTRVEGFQFSVANGALLCTPPALSAEVPPGTNEFTRLVWKDVFGQVVSNVDWQATLGFELVGAPTSGVVIARHGFATYWSRLQVKGHVTAYGKETLTPSVLPSGSGTLTLTGAFVINADLKKTPQLLNAAHLGIGPGSVMNVSHGGTNLDVSGQDWRGIVGTGRLIFTDAKSSWIAAPSLVFADTLSVETTSDVVLTQQISPSNPFGVRNLSGDGSFRSDWGNGSNLRPVRTVQTQVSAFKGTFSAIDKGRDSKLIVSSDAPMPTTQKALILSGSNTATHTLDIETNGCVILTGSWKGTINVSGLLIVTNANVLTGANVNGTYEVRSEIPSVTPSSDAYVPPVYPEDPPVPVDPPVVDSRVRCVRATAPAGSTVWSDLDWYDAKGALQVTVDWSAVTNAALCAESASTRVVFDMPEFSGIVRLEGGVSLEARVRCPFTLAAESVGAVDFLLSPVPTSTCDLLSVTESLPSDLQTLVTVHDRYGREIDVAGEVMFDATKRKYYLNVQNVARPAYSNTFDTQYDDTLTTSLGFNGSGNLTYQAYPERFESSRSGRALKGAGLQETIHSHNGNPTVDMSNVNAWSINFVVKLPTNDRGIIFGWGNKDRDNGIALARVSEDRAGVYAWTNAGAPQLVVSATVPFASTQFHSYAITHDGHTLCLYADGVLAQSAPLEGKYPTTGHYQYFKMYGQNGGLENGTSAVVDDFRLYLYCLTPTSARVIANAFKPWPEIPTAQIWEPETKWSDLVWNTTIEDWTALKSARLEGVKKGASLWCDEATFTHEIDLVGGLTLLATNELPFVLAPYPKGRVAFTLDDITTSHRLVRVANGFACSDDDFGVTVQGKDGALPRDPWMVTRYSDGAYWLRVQDIAKPKYGFSFDGALSTILSGVTAPALKDTDNVSWEDSRSGRALTGRNPYFESGLGMPSSWTMNIVARQSSSPNGICFAYGNSSKGLALFSPQTDVVALGGWSGSGRTLFVRATVPNAHIQFHSYAIVSTGSKIALWVDGEKIGEAPCSGYPGNGNAQFFSVHGGTPSGFAVGTDGAIDDWRFFEECLAPSGIKMLADEFKPWPEFRIAEVTEPETDGTSLTWQGLEGENKQCLIKSLGGTLTLTNVCSLSTPLTVIGSSLPIKISGDGLLRSDAGMRFSSDWSIDASGLDGTNLAKCAVAGAPYVRWLVRGAYTGRPTVTALPAMPKNYTVHAENFSAFGVRLVITAPKGAHLGSVSVSIGKDDFSGLTGELGLYPERANAWLPYTTWSTAFQPFGEIEVGAIDMENGQIDSESPYAAPAPLFFRHTSFDGNNNNYDGKECGYVLSNLTAFAAQYRILVYMASNQGSSWGPVTIGGRNYSGLLKDSDVQWATLSDSALSAWGMRSATPREGVNVVISDVLTNDVVSIIGHRRYGAYTARGQIAAFQVVKVGEIPELTSVDYSATMTRTTCWANGAGEGLDPSCEWVNDVDSTITLTTGVACATLTFDTPVTADVLRVSSAADTRLTLTAAPGVDVCIGSIDWANTRGEIALSNMPAQVALNLTSGARVRFDEAVTAVKTTASRAIVAYRSATFNPGTTAIDWVLRLEEPDDRVTLDGALQYISVDLAEGVLTWPKTRMTQAIYAGVALDGTNSVINVSGGTFACNLSGNGSNNNRGFIFGNTGGARVIPTLAVSAGVFDCSSSVFSPWEKPVVQISGGTFKALGIVKGGNNAGRMSISDGVVELGHLGIGAYTDSNATSFPLTLTGGKIRAMESCAVTQPVTVRNEATLSAVAGATLSLNVKVTGDGALACGTASDTGSVVFKKGVAETVALGGSFSLWLTEAQTNAQEKVALFRTAPSFDRTKFTLLGPNGTALPDGKVRYVGGQAIWTPACLIDEGTSGFVIIIH